MRESRAQTEILPADVNLGGQMSIPICISSYNGAFICLTKGFFSFPSPGTITSGNGEFGDWSAFNQTAPCPAAPAGDVFSSSDQPAAELFGSSGQQGLGQSPAAANSADMFDLMGTSQATMTSSQSMNFSMMGSNTVSINLPMSRSQVCNCSASH